MKKKIHFILPGGGVKGSFQAGFLYELHKSAHNYFTINQIDGTSVGALNGYVFALGRIDDIYSIWSKITSIRDIFENWIELPYLCNISCGYNLVNHYGLYRNNKLQSLITDVEKRFIKENEMVNSLREDICSSDTYKDKDKDKDKLLKRFNCVVTSIRGGHYKYINGTNAHIKEFVTASASPWIVTNPLEIEGELYTDGGLLHTFPLDNIGTSDSDITVIIGYDESYENTRGTEGSNALSYLARIIDIVRLNHNNMDSIKKIVNNKSPDVIIIKNPINVNFLDVNQDIIKRGFDYGKEAALTFIKEYIISK